MALTRGWKVSDLWNEHRELFGKAEGDVFPLLTKILDAEDDLSVKFIQTTAMV